MVVHKTEVLVLGGGVAGYSAAFRAADLGMNVTLVERYESLGGVCLNVGCIPSKALLHVAEVINEGKHGSAIGVHFGHPNIDLGGVREFKNDVVAKLTQGVEGMANQRKVKVIRGLGEFLNDRQITVKGDEHITQVEFSHAIIAAGSHAVDLPFLPKEDSRVWNSTDALELNNVPERLLVVGGGIIGMEMATVFGALGSEVSVVEFADQLIPAADRDLVQVYTRYNQNNFKLMLSTKVTEVKALKSGLCVAFEGKTPQRRHKHTMPFL